MVRVYHVILVTLRLGSRAARRMISRPYPSALTSWAHIPTRLPISLYHGTASASAIEILPTHRRNTLPASQVLLTHVPMRAKPSRPARPLPAGPHVSPTPGIIPPHGLGTQADELAAIHVLYSLQVLSALVHRFRHGLHGTSAAHGVPVVHVHRALPRIWPLLAHVETVAAFRHPARERGISDSSAIGVRQRAQPIIHAPSVLGTPHVLVAVHEHTRLGFHNGVAFPCTRRLR